MADYQLVIIGAGLSGLASGIRAARFGLKTLILEQHSLPGGLNSYYFRKGFLLETGLHAMTNYAEAGDKRAPLNRLFRQLKLSRKKFATHQQFSSLIRFPHTSLQFSNDITLLQAEIDEHFPHCRDSFQDLLTNVADYDPFAPSSWRSTRQFLNNLIPDPLLIDMLLLPLMVYGNSEEHDMDLGQFVIMFRSIFLEGFFRPDDTMKEFLAMLVEHYKGFGGELRYKAKVESVERKDEEVKGVRIAGGDYVSCDTLLSTVGAPGTAKLVDWPKEPANYEGRMSFVESISVLPSAQRRVLNADHTIIFYNSQQELSYARPQRALSPDWGVICFPENFHDLPKQDFFQVRVTNAANYDIWKQTNSEEYQQLKVDAEAQTFAVVSEIIGNYQKNRVYQDSFTPLTIERFTSKAQGAVYGSPVKIKDGLTPYSNLFVAGTDQGFLGIVGAMLSGVTIVNQQVLR
ncbi:MAG: FAD-dependent oxidoreductase [Thermodesulfobacteriota bacterium]